MVHDRNLKYQMDRLQQILEGHSCFRTILDRADSICLPDWYIGAGCITTIVWNALSGNADSLYLNDIDLVYYDADNLSQAQEDMYQRQVATLYGDVSVRFDVVNQARVHLWYEQQFGHSILPYRSVESGIDTWLSVTAIGIRKQRGKYSVYAPYGLEDLFTMTIRPNPLLITEEHYRKKCTRWKRQWPSVNVLPWDV